MERAGSAEAGRSFVYCVDARDRVEHVSPAWLAFARENGAPELTADRVIGRPLWAFIRGMETQSVYRALFRSVRESGAAVKVPFRCDSPLERRYMELEVAPGESAGLELTGRLLRTRTRGYLAVLDSLLPRGTSHVELCSFCKRVHRWGRGWFEADDAPDGDGRDDLPGLVHGVCDDCAEAFAACLERGRGVSA